MKNNRKNNGIIGLVTVTILAVAVILAANLLSNKEGSKAALSDDTKTATESLSTIDVTGYESGSIKILSASETEDGYLVTVSSPGFIDDIVMDVTFDKTGDTITSLVIKEQNETPELGGRVEEEAFTSKFSGVLAPVYLPGQAPTTSNDTTTQDSANNEATVDTSSLIDGTYTAEAADFDKGGFKGTVTLTVADGKITEVVWDAYNEAGEYKSLLSADGAYVMTEDGLTWQEQAIALAEYVVANQSIDIPVDNAGKTDAIAGVSISINPFIDLVSNCLEQASPKTLKDGTYTVEGEERNGFVSIVTIVIENGKITSVVWDARNEVGEYKSYISTVGEYVMVEGNPTWKEQADALATNVIENQSTSGIIMDDKGKTDSVAGVSISVNEFVSLVEEALKKASSGETAEEVVAEEPATNTENTSAAGTEIEAISGATISSEAVLDGVNEAMKFIKEFVLK